MVSVCVEKIKLCEHILMFVMLFFVFTQLPLRKHILNDRGLKISTPETVEEFWLNYRLNI